MNTQVWKIILSLLMACVIGTTSAKNNRVNEFKKPTHRNGAIRHKHYHYVTVRYDKSKVDDTNELAEHITVMRRLKNALWMINDGIDYMLTVKGAVKTLVLLTPFMVLYCKYFDKDPIQNLINKIIQFVGSAEELYEIQREVGKTKAFWEMLKSQPWNTLSVTAKKILNKTVYVGLPFMAGILFKLGVGAK